MKKKVLISGASIAGLTAAYWLNRYGYEVTVVETALKPREGGSPVDLRGAATDVARRMGILEKIQDLRLNTESIEFVNARNECVGIMPMQAPDGDVELRRDHLVHCIYEKCQDGVEYLFSNGIQHMTQTPAGVTVIFKSGETRDFDWVIGADGVHSTVRRLIFGEEERFARFLGMYFAIAEVDPALGKKNNGQMYNTPGKMATIYSYSEKADALLAFRSPRIPYDYRSTADQKKILTEAFAGSVWKIPEILDIFMRSEKIYFDEACQIKMPSWTHHRVALVGDAAYCASFPTGMGSSLAMQGAALLADALAESDGDPLIVPANYHQSLRPYVEAAQATVTEGMAFLVPETEEAIRLRNEMMN